MWVRASLKQVYVTYPSCDISNKIDQIWVSHGCGVFTCRRWRFSWVFLTGISRGSRKNAWHFLGVIDKAFIDTEYTPWYKASICHYIKRVAIKWKGIRREDCLFITLKHR